MLHRLISRVREMGVVVIAASRMDGSSAEQFPASVAEVISVGSSDTRQNAQHRNTGQILAPGSQIMVATPDGGYDFRSGTSISAAHVSGVVALLISVSPEISRESIASLLYRSQQRAGTEVISVDACQVLHLANSSLTCTSAPIQVGTSEPNTGT